MASDLAGGIDLHIHTTASDGTFSPSEILQMAAAANLRAFSITDHDTLEGTRVAARLPLPPNLRFITGVEISTQPPEGFSISGSLHILGYGIEVNCASLQQALVELQQARGTRIPRIVERLNRIGVPVRMEQVLKLVGGGTPGRPHVGRVMIDIGVVKDIDQAFDLYLGKGKPAYVDKYRIDWRRAMELIRRAGGVPVLAHPYLVPGGGEREVAAALIETLRNAGLMGIEVYYPEHPPAAVALYMELAGRFDLLMTGGSDFHGELSPAIQLGSGRGDLKVPFALYEALAARASRP